MDTNESPTEISEDVACSASGGMCQTTVTLTLDDVSAGRLYFVSVRARNRYGESEPTGSSDFRIGSSSGEWASERVREGESEGGREGGKEGGSRKEGRKNNNE